MQISEDIHRTFMADSKVSTLVNKVLLDISNQIMAEDAAIIKTLKGFELDRYMNVEMYHALVDKQDAIRDAGEYDHRPVDCPVCSKLHQIEFILDCLIDKWKQRGVYEAFKVGVKFRADALDSGRTVN